MKASLLLMPKPVSVINSFKKCKIDNIGFKKNKDLESFIVLCEKQFGFTGSKKIIKLEINPLLEKEEYNLIIKRKSIYISSGSENGLYHAMQTINQLKISCSTFIPCCKIYDKPKFSYRGFMIDCSRNFFSIDELKKLIDIASMHHLNIFHWHLIDDQGWRLEIEGLDLLTNIGAKRQSVNYEIPYIEHDYYSTEQVKDLIKFCKDRFIEIIPEIELPGHSRALLASYPEYGCKQEGYSVVAHWGIFDDVLCFANDKLESFLDKIIGYTASLFPGRYIHIGGDECPTTSWENCEKCQAKKKELGLKTDREIQSYLTVMISKIVAKYNKIPIGWDEVLENTENLELPKDLIVMSWRGSKGGIEASKRNHKVIMCPNTEGCYFDYKNYDDINEPGNLGVNTIFDVNSYNPTPSEMNDFQKSMVLGGQANIWTEKIMFAKNLEYMLFPRLSIISEVLWNPQDFDFVEKRKENLINRLRKCNVECYSGPFK